VVVVAVVVVAIVVVAVLALAGVFKPSTAGGQGVTGTPLSYNQAAPSGTEGVQNQSGGPWTLIAAEGLGLTSSSSGTNAAGFVDSGCTGNPAPGSPSSTTLPATPTGSAAGTVAVWFFLAEDSSDQLLIYVVTQAANYPLVIVAGSCTSEFSSLASIAGLAVLNSTVVASTALSSGGSAFLASQTGALQVFVLLGAGVSGSTVPYWAVEYDTCGLSSSGTGTVFIGLYNADTGVAVTAATTESINC
jgi:hypothetical protein